VIKKLLIVSLMTSITTMALNAKNCKQTLRDGSIATFTVTDNICDYSYPSNVIGKMTVKYKNGKLKRAGSYKNGKREGVNKEYFKNGKLEDSVTYKNGKKEGPFKSYFENGQLSTSTTFKNDKHNGIYKNYYKNGKIKFEASYNNGIPTGTHKWLNQKGTIANETIYENGKEISKKYYYDNGKIKGEEIFSANNRSIKNYFPNGKIKYTATYKGNYIFGPEKEYLENGTLVKDFNWANGKKSGLEVIVSRQGYKYRREVIYKNNDVISEKKFSNNLLSLESTSKNNKRVKNYYNYNQDGKLTSIYSKYAKKTTYYKLDGSIDRVE